MLASDIIKALTSRVFAAPALKVDDVAEELEALAIDDSLAEIEVDGSAEVEIESEAKVEPTQASVPAAVAMVNADLASSFELGQLVFVVGHVAIKHIVYLELVERELKRRKEEKTAAGQSPSLQPLMTRLRADGQDSSPFFGSDRQSVWYRERQRQRD